jgi:hypothetical protein
MLTRRDFLKAGVKAGAVASHAHPGCAWLSREPGPLVNVPDNQRELSVEDWKRLLYLAHADKRRVFEEYSNYYRSTSASSTGRIRIN